MLMGAGTHLAKLQEAKVFLKGGQSQKDPDLQELASLWSTE